MKRTAIGKKEVNSMEVSKEKEEVRDDTNAEKGERQGSKGWGPWWPKNKEKEELLATPGDTGTGIADVNDDDIARGVFRIL
jgi:hypothetical protein